MKNELFKNLQIVSDFDCFNCLIYQPLLQQNSGFKKYNTAQINHSIKCKLRNIQNIQATKNKPKILIVEREPWEFITSFLASVIAKVDIFLADPDWGQREWYQVGQLIQPQLILGDLSIASFFGGDFAPPELSTQITSSLIMIPTGGTSGKVRFAMHTWETLKASVAGFAEYFEHPVINSCCTLPLFHVSGLMQLIRSLRTGGDLVIMPYKILLTAKLPFNPARFLISLVPTQLGVIINSAPEVLAQFKLVLLGGAPAGRSLLEQARKAKIPVSSIYGMTETASGIVALRPQDFLAGNLSQGRVMPHSQIKLDPSNKQFENSQSEQFDAGNITISSQSLCLGYYPKCFEAENFLTDDVGYFDQDGFLWLVGRNSQKIITGGKNVYPPEIESEILATELVSDVCIFGLSDSYWGQAVTAVCVLRPHGSLESIQNLVSTNLAKYKQPKYWITVAAIPRNKQGKVNYQSLQAIAKAAINNQEA